MIVARVTCRRYTEPKEALRNVPLGDLRFLRSTNRGSVSYDLALTVCNTPSLGDATGTVLRVFCACQRVTNEQRAGKIKIIIGPFP